MSGKPLVRAKIRRILPVTRTAEFERALSRVLAALVAAGETAHLDAAGEPVLSRVLLAALDALADKAERRAAKRERP